MAELICNTCKVYNCECVPYDVECDSCRRAYEQGKADAIDEFIAKIEEHIAYSYEHNICYSSIMSIAEQMKEKKNDLSELDS